jgi:hypothetical protein
LNEKLVEHEHDELVKDVTAGVYAIGRFTDSSFVGVGSAGLRCSSGGGQPANKERKKGERFLFVKNKEKPGFWWRGV